MIKAKPKKKREIKINEVKEINIIKKPSDIKLEVTQFITIILNISRVCENHKRIWDNQIKHNDGVIKFDKLMLISQVKKTADNLFDDYFEPREDSERIDDDDFENNIFYTNLMNIEAQKYIEGLNEVPVLTVDDIVEKLPAGFTATLFVWKSLIKEFETAKVKKVIKTLKIDNFFIDRLIKLSNKYFSWIKEEIKIERLGA